VLEGELLLNNNCFNEALSFQEPLVNPTVATIAREDYFVKKSFLEINKCSID